MLKLESNIIPSWNIDGTNKVFEYDFVLGGISEVLVDGSSVSGFSYKWTTLTLDVAPNTSISSNVFSRDVNQITGSWSVTLWTMRNDFYWAIWRINPDGSIPQNIMKLYPEDTVMRELRRAYKRVVNKSPESLSVQQYSYKWKNGYSVSCTA